MFASGSVAVTTKVAEALFSAVVKVAVPPEKTGAWLGAGWAGAVMWNRCKVQGEAQANGVANGADAQEI